MYYYYYYRHYYSAVAARRDNRTKALSNAIPLLISASSQTPASPSTVRPSSLFYLFPSLGWRPWRYRIGRDRKQPARYRPDIQKPVVVVVKLVLLTGTFHWFPVEKIRY